MIVSYLFSNKGTKIYQIIYLVMIFLGAVMSLDLVWELTDTINFYCEEDIQYNKEHPLKSAFSVSYTKSTCFSAFKQPCIPAGYCEKCDRIIADIEIRESYNPIGEESLPTYDMDYYSIGTESTINDKNVYVMEDPSYEEWTDLIEWNNSDDETEE